MFTFDNSYVTLPDTFYTRVKPTPVREARVLRVNEALAELLGVSAAELASPAGAAVLAGNEVPAGADPIALAYAGHQFGSFVSQLGDGRAILLGEVIGKDGKRYDVQLKGPGRTPYSRGGDGRAAMGPVLREYIVSEAMAALGIPTTRSLAAVATGEPVFREEALPGCVLTRVASSHVRVGTFELLAARDDEAGVATLTRYVLARHYPDAVGSDNEALALLGRVLDAQASLVARWMGVGFVHGVMNTDNTTVSGETIDYGPCAFLDEYHPAKTFSSIDRQGRYAFANQPRIAHWNLARLAEALLPLIHDDEEEAARLAMAELSRFGPVFDAAFTVMARRKLGLHREDEGDLVLFRSLLERMAEGEVDFTVFFRSLAAAAENTSADEGLAAMFATPGAFHDWAETWRARVASESTTPAERASAMRRANPALVPRNHRIEQAIVSAQQGDLAPFEELVGALARPYEELPPALQHLAEPPARGERVTRTFCGT